MKGVPALFLAAATIGAQGDQSPLDRVIPEPIEITTAATPCTVPGYAGRIAKAVRMPLGVEHLAEPCARNPAKLLPTDIISLGGLTAREALDRLIALDPRYRWTESGGVVVIRPESAWADPHDFLNRTISSFVVPDENLGYALAALKTALGPINLLGDRTFPDTFSTPEANRHFSVALGATSPIEALNATVRAHGSLTWSVMYCLPEPRYQYANIVVLTFDGGGMGAHSISLDENGKSYDACQAKRTR
jgi:hypothetical protein